MNVRHPIAKIKHWRSDRLLNVGFSSYSLTHHSFPRHFHEHYVIQLVVQGTDKFYCSGNTYDAAANEIVFINPGEVGGWMFRKPTVAICDTESRVAEILDLPPMSPAVMLEVR